ncbi:MAG: hypothetical protein M9953_09750 [Thermomicrobiales bacterium]|nr:hypothetical protein [Thermomicrobiales bacterium]MCO5217785.1 hypothetical protein [Thermomicrobiales bacterium]MCO5225611.1 hypothetical protein [Thermomicrobiales bacterium]MCO5227520.1 hypothetical protein [Thermomicrobiales bacterium]
METTTSSYEIRFLLNGEEGKLVIDAQSAAAAAELAKHQAAGEGDDFELIQVQLADDDSALDLS